MILQPKYWNVVSLNAVLTVWMVSATASNQSVAQFQRGITWVQKKNSHFPIYIDIATATSVYCIVLYCIAGRHHQASLRIGHNMSWDIHLSTVTLQQCSLSIYLIAVLTQIRHTWCLPQDCISLHCYSSVSRISTESLSLKSSRWILVRVARFDACQLTAFHDTVVYKLHRCQ